MKRIDADELMDYERMAMAEYIKRGDALRILEDGEYWPIGKLYDDILHLPAADVAEARHGKWISVKDSLPQTDVSYLVCTNKGAVCTLHYYTVTMNTCRLMIAFIPKPRIIRPIGWVYMINTLGNKCTSR